MTKRLGVYCRLSKDDTGSQTATLRQEKACRAFAELRGWCIGGVYEDVDLSAYRARVTRPGYEALLVDLADGRIDGVLVWKLDRLMRRPAEFERFWSVCEAAGASLASATEPIDTSNELGLALVRILVTFAGLESATMSVRMRAKQKEVAEAGRPPGGPAPFGHTKRMAAVVEDEAELIREAARRLVAGESLNGIVIDWNSRHIRTRLGLPFSAATIREILASHRLVGDRTHHGVVVASDCWPPILDRVLAAKVRAVLADHSRRAPYPTKKYLLTGFLRCGWCGMRMHGRVRQHRPTYGCPEKRSNGCGSVWCSGVPVEAYVLGQVMERLRRPPEQFKPQTREPTDTELVAALEEHAAEMERLSRQRFIEHTLSPQAFAAAGLALAAEFHHRTTQLLPDHTGPLPTGLSTNQIEDAWPNLSLRQQKAVIGSQLHYVVVAPAGQGSGPRFKPERLTLHWWEPPPSQSVLSASSTDDG